MNLSTFVSFVVRRVYAGGDIDSRRVNKDGKKEEGGGKDGLDEGGRRTQRRERRERRERRKEVKKKLTCAKQRRIIPIHSAHFGGVSYQLAHPTTRSYIISSTSHFK